MKIQEHQGQRDQEKGEVTHQGIRIRIASDANRSNAFKLIKEISNRNLCLTEGKGKMKTVLVV
jgi:hypothetical protein